MFAKGSSFVVCQWSAAEEGPLRRGRKGSRKRTCEVLDDHGDLGGLAREAEGLEKHAEGVVDADALEVEGANEGGEAGGVLAAADVLCDLLLQHDLPQEGHQEEAVGKPCLGGGSRGASR